MSKKLIERSRDLMAYAVINIVCFLCWLCLPEMALEFDSNNDIEEAEG
jgi:hypothetical protein